MSQNTELVIRGLSAATKRPKPDYETVNALFHADHVLVPVAAGRFGEAEAKGGRGYKDWLEANEQAVSFELELDGAIDIGPNTVMAMGTLRVQGASSGIDMESPHWFVVRVADGQIVRTEAYMEPAEALEAARLSQ